MENWSEGWTAGWYGGMLCRQGVWSLPEPGSTLLSPGPGNVLSGSLSFSEHSEILQIGRLNSLKLLNTFQ